MILSNELHPILKNFEPIALADMEAVTLMNRNDKKYIFHLRNLPHFLNNCVNHYSVFTINNQVYSTHLNDYYDTPRLELYMQHHNGKLNRCKIRKRTYAESNVSFLEIKFKNNKDRTEKNRIPLTSNNLNKTAFDFIENETGIAATNLLPSIAINYTRIALVNKLYPERVTIDMNITANDGLQNHSFDNLVIAEVKQDKHKHSAFIELMDQYRFKENPVSKYCLGINHLMDDVKMNNFKENNNRINKLLQA